MSVQKNGVRPVLLRPDNFTPPPRTPWGGTRIRALKERWVGEGPPVGEAWELSVEPSFPSRCEPGGELLTARIEEDRERWLGAEEAAGGTALLVKLLDAAEALSVQIHPADDYPGLRAGESGKPESWYVVDRVPGSGLYVGLAAGVDASAMTRALEDGADLSKLLGFVPVEPGDFLLIEAGTPHCIGAGVMLVEPQVVRPGLCGVTYRYWDWGRRYDAQGRASAAGEPRALHRDDALAVTRWSQPRGDALLRSVRVRAGAPAMAGAARLEMLAGPEGAPLGSPHLRVGRMAGTGSITLPEWDVLRGLSVLEGSVELGELLVEAGRTAAIPANWHGRVELRRAHAVLSSAG